MNLCLIIWNWDQTRLWLQMQNVVREFWCAGLRGLMQRARCNIFRGPGLLTIGLQELGSCLQKIYERLLILCTLADALLPVWKWLCANHVCNWINDFTILIALYVNLKQYALSPVNMIMKASHAFSEKIHLRNRWV